MKRLLSCILALTLVICMVPETVGIAFADDSVQAEVFEEAAAAPAAEATEEIEAENTDAEDEAMTPIEVAEPLYAAAEETAAEDTEEAATTEEPAATEESSETAPSETPAQEETSGEGTQEEVAPAEDTAGEDTDEDVTPGEEPAEGETPEEEVPEEPEEIDISEASVELSKTVFKFNGEEKTPKVKSVTLPDGTVVDSERYTVKYSKNTKAGTAKVIVKGRSKANATGRVEAYFTILGKMDRVDAADSDRKQKSIKVTWTKYDKTEIDGYKLYKYSEKKGKYIVVKTVKDPDKESFTVKKLTATTRYKFKIAPYKADPATGKTVIGPMSDAKALKTAPEAPATKAKITKLYCKAPYVLVGWKNIGKKNANRYQIQYSRDPNFKNAHIITIKGSKYSSKRMYGLRGYVRYYFRVRCGMAFGGQEEYGKWSKASSVYSYNTGWTTYKGRQYYYQGGKPLKGSHYINGNPYYFDTKTGELHGCSARIWKKVKNATSDTMSLVTIDCTNHRVNVFRKRDGDWVCIKQWICSSGQTETVGEYKKTPKGTFKLRYKLKHFGEEKGYTCWYACNFSGHSFIHSVLYNPGSMTSIQDGRLGINASHGCVRLALKNAKWIYDHVKKGSTVISTF